MRTVREKTQDQLDLQACHRVRSRLVSRRTATINQIRAFLIEQGIAVRTGSRALRNSLLAILKDCQDEISPRMGGLIAGLYEDWICLDERMVPARHSSVGATSAHGLVSSRASTAQAADPSSAASQNEGASISEPCSSRPQTSS